MEAPKLDRYIQGGSDEGVAEVGGGGCHDRHYKASVWRAYDRDDWFEEV